MMFFFHKKNAAHITLRLGHYSQKYTKNISNETRVSLAHLFNDSSRACPSLQRQQQESWYPRPSCILVFSSTPIVSLSLYIHPLSENVDFPALDINHPESQPPFIHNHSLFVAWSTCWNSVAAARSPHMFSLLSWHAIYHRSLKVRSLACSPGFAGLLQKIHENGDQSQCGISVKFQSVHSSWTQIQRTV